MGPKKEPNKASGNSTAVGSSKKKQNEDMLRKLQEEEEARKKAEEEERDRKRHEAELLAKNKETAKQEKKQRRIQMGELDAILDYNKSCAERVDTEKRHQSKWQRYLRCDGTPDPTIPAEINTYINLLLEEPGSTVDDAFAKCKVLISLVEELKLIIADTPPDQLSPETLEQYKTTLARLQCLIQYKLDQASYDELIHASENVNPETSNLERTLTAENLVSLCVWGNLIKNPRIRSHEFPEIGFTFEIPKPIGNSSVAVRVLHTAFDHCSHLTKTCVPKKKVIEVPETPVAAVEEKTPVPASQPKEEVHEEEANIEEPKETDILAQLNFLDKPKAKEKTEDKIVVEEEEPEYDLAPTPPPEEYEDYEELIDVVDLRQNQPVGGVFHINLLQLPPQPKTVNNWTIRLLQTPAQLHFVDYVATTTHYYPVAVSLAGPMAQTLNFALGFTNMLHTLASAHIRKNPDLFPLMGIPERKCLEPALPRKKPPTAAEEMAALEAQVAANAIAAGTAAPKDTETAGQTEKQPPQVSEEQPQDEQSQELSSKEQAEEEPTVLDQDQNLDQQQQDENVDEGVDAENTGAVSREETGVDGETFDNTEETGVTLEQNKTSWLGDLLEQPSAAGQEIMLTPRGEDETAYNKHERQPRTGGKKVAKKVTKISTVAPGEVIQERKKPEKSEKKAKSKKSKSEKGKSKHKLKAAVMAATVANSSSGGGATLSEGGGKDKAADAESKEKEVRPPVPVVLKLPPNVMFFEAPQVSRWHDDRKCWVSDAVTNLQYKEDQRLLSFRLERFGIFSLIQDRHINMPFQSWEMRPLEMGRVLVHIVAAIAEVEIEIAGDKCALVKPDDKSEVHHLIGQFMSLDQFIEAMKNAGINLFPEPDSYKFVGVQNKNRFVEKRVYQHMALVASGMAFAWSKWNADCNDSQRFLLQAVSWGKAEAPVEDDWKLIQIERRRAVQLAMTEFADGFNDERAPDSPYSSTIFHLAKHMCGGAESPNWSRVVDSPYQFILTVERFLAATRLLVFS